MKALKFILITSLFAGFVLVSKTEANSISEQAEIQQALSEKAKIELLIKSISDLKGASFIRNGSSHSAKEAAEHLKKKWEYAEDDIETAAQFIEKLASKSSISGKAYIIRLADGTDIMARVFLVNELRRIESK
ncbi:MAG: DUF5329 domain-containing protein [Salibacteraceae bacterium]|nr:DUF5329 domain-containing protein [Salibacteraceae bacterium]MDP4762089.1 DUF5329 domain-containing protein [Salibacteraceae bacterium]MDP4845060.1 DUF5329 domain-containing protein [Salibacteraceae bacterium]MDP4965134.1 DUF5329 domain-containing protein [Salibacteraceae bacterium]